MSRAATGSELVAWLRGSGLAGVEALGDARLAIAAPGRVVAQGRQLREALRDALDRARSGASVPGELVGALGRLLRPARNYLHLTHDEGHLRAERRWVFETAEDLLAPIAEAAVSLLTEVDLARVRECGDDACVLLFHDTSKNGSRRWCSMQTCGNRHKA